MVRFYSLMIICSVGLAGCSGLTKEGGFFEDKSRDYANARSIDRPLTSDDIKGVYSPRALYPVKREVSGPLIEEVPRVTSAFIPLEQGSIVLQKASELDRILFSRLYEPLLLSGLKEYWEEKGVAMVELDTSQLATMIPKSQIKGDIQAIFVTDWTSGQVLGYEPPGFWRRLFGGGYRQHQFVFFVSTPEPLTQISEQFSIQVHGAHRHKSQPDQWSFSSQVDQVLGVEIVNMVEHLKRTMAQNSLNRKTDFAATLERDGNGLPYLSISARFSLVWENLLDVLPTKQWQIEDLDRSKGIIFVNVINEGDVERLSVKQFRLQLSEGPQSSILSVEMSDEQPASIPLSEAVLDRIKSRFQHRK